ncbi:ATP-binding cassette domain-containing protein [Streptomyces sp. DHE17-7]|uniref:ATP-binding cassette domain-containing protein n=1 Tax=Streptomyces sp. DHE17-7 TaxID=2759949 RepID=UPI000EBCB9B7|nr:ABC transporter ATP-binding protein [Streptomyces sp. DHE17-7]MBJ6620670.1 ABC transporter ATP-binding protein [Streptomyces sp. DHE17-7]RIH62106.1 ABC transporter ATP-binding protein [Streptomyces sp. SHP22-7]
MTADQPLESVTRHPGRAADRILLRTARAGGAWTVLLLVTATLSTVAQILFPALLGKALDAVLDGAGGSRWVIGCLVAVAAVAAADALFELAAGVGAARGVALLRHSMLGSLLSWTGPGAARSATGDLVSRLVGAAGEAGAVAAVLVRAALSVVPAVGSVIALALIDPWLAGTFLLGFPAVVMVLRTFTRRMSDVSTRYQEAQGRLATALLEALAGRRTIAAAGTAEAETRRILRTLPELSRLGHGMWQAQTGVAGRSALLTPLLEIGVLSVAGFALSAGRITAGEMLAAAQYVAIGSGVGMTTMLLGRLARARAGAERVRGALSRPALEYGARTLPPGPGTLELRDVRVVAGGETVLDGVDLTVPGGSCVALVGASGSGKSLLAAVAGRLADPDAGTVALDGVPLRRLTREDLRSAVAHAFERPVLFGETLGEAIAWGTGRAADEVPAERIERAARAADADGFVRRLPEDYRTPQSEAALSGGEVQRLGLARAFVHRGRLLVLDDATSSLDTVTEHRVGAVLTGALRDRTRVVVAHRAATAARADTVAWLDGGRVRRVGPHRELWRTEPAYRRVFRGAADADADAAADAEADAADVDADAGAEVAP